MTDLYDFMWEAPADGDGFHVSEWRAQMGIKRLSDIAQMGINRLSVIAPRPGMQSRSYAPLREEPALFRIFAEAEETPDAYLDLANRYGLLTRAPILQVHPYVTEANLDAWVAHRPVSHITKWGHKTFRPPRWRGEGEPVLLWMELTRWLWPLVALWDRIQAEDPAGLAECVRWETDKVTVRVPSRAGGEYAKSWPLGDVPGPVGDLVIPARKYLHEQVNVRLGWEIAPLLALHHETRASSLVLMPPSLWSAVVLQFAQAIGEGKRYQKCPVCGRWFELAPGLNRAHKQFCSGTCRTKNNRAKRDRAIQLHADGKTVREIAQELESDLETVKGWIGRAK